MAHLAYGNRGLFVIALSPDSQLSHHGGSHWAYLPKAVAANRPKQFRLRLFAAYKCSTIKSTRASGCPEALVVYAFNLSY